MASLLSWLGNGVKRVANTVNNDVIQPIQRDVVAPVVHTVVPQQQQTVSPQAQQQIQNAKYGVLAHNPQAQRSFINSGKVNKFNPVRSFPSSFASGVNQTIIKPAVNTAKLPVNFGSFLGAELSHDNPTITKATNTLANNANNSFIGPLAQTAELGGASLAGRSILNNPNTSPQIKQQQLQHVNQALQPIGFNLNDSRAKTNLKLSSLAAQDISLPALMKVGKIASELKPRGEPITQMRVADTKAPQVLVKDSQKSAQLRTTQNPVVSSSKVPTVPIVQQSEKLSPPTKQTELSSPPGQVIPYNDYISLVKQRGLVTSVKSSDQVSPSVRKGVSGEYTTRNTAQLAAKAEQRASSNLPRVTQQVNQALDSKLGTISDQNVADAIAVAKAHDANGNFDQAQQIYDKLAEHGTKGGQQIQAFSLLSSRTPQGMKFQALRSLKKAGLELDSQGQKDLQGHIENVKGTAIGTPERDMAIHNLVKFVNDRIPSSLGDKTVNFWRAGLLTSPVTTAGNILGNATEAATRNLWTNPVAAAADKAMSLVTGKRTKTLTGGQASGANVGLSKAANYLKTGFDSRNPAAKFDAKQVNYNNKAINTYVNGVYRWMGGQDQPFYYAAERQAARDLATADAKNLKLTGKAKVDYIAKAESDPNWKPQTFKSKSNVETAAKYSVYQNDTLMGHIAAGAKNYATQHSSVGGAIANFLLPFTQVPASVAMRIIDRTPLGIAKEVVTQLANKSFDQRALAEAIGNGTFAPGVIFAGAKLAQAGQITGAYPTDPKEQELWKSEGKQPFSVKVGNRWYSLNYMQPFGTLLALGGQVHNDIKNGSSPQEAWGAAGATAAKSVESQSFLQGLNGALSAINDPQRSAAQYVTSTASSVVPNLIRSGARATDPLQRDAKGVIPGVKGAIPGVRETLPAKQDMFGRPLPRVDNAINQFTNPFRPSIAKTNDQVVNELRRLQDAQNGIIPTQYNKSAIKGTKLTDQQVRQLQTNVGGKVHGAWQQIINDPRYKSLNDADKATALKKAMDAIGGAGKATLQANNNLIPDKGLKLSTNTKKVLNGTQPDYFAASTSTGGNSAVAPADKYKAALDKFNQNQKAMSDVQKYTAQQNLAKLKVQAPFSNDVISLYGQSKAKIADFVNNNPKGADLYKQLQSYDQALLSAGQITTSKFKNGLATTTTGSKSSKGSTTKKGKAIGTTSVASYLKAFKAAQVKPIKTPTAPNIKVGTSSAPKFKSISLKQYSVKKPHTSNFSKLLKVA